MPGTAMNPRMFPLAFVLLIGGMVLPVLAREEIAVLDGGGWAVDISGERIVVGNPFVAVGPLSFAGEVYVFERDGSGWTLDATLTASVPGEWDMFGYAVALEGDLLVVGAPADEMDFWHEGAAYVFRRQGGIWIEEQKLISGFVHNFDDFGRSVDVQGDLLAISDSLFHMVFIFRYNDGNWIEEARLDPAGSVGSDIMGWSVSLGGDWLVAGAPSDSEVATRAGAAYVFLRSGTTWSEEQKLTAADGAEGDFFGDSVAISGPRLVVGAPGRVGGFYTVGGAYVFELTGSTWGLQATIGYPTADIQGRAGDSVALDGDRLVLGAPAGPTTGEGVVAAYLFRLYGSEWFMLDRLSHSGPDLPSSVGISAALEGHLSVVGSQFTETYVFDLSGDIPTISEWGMLALTLSVLVAGTVLLRRRKQLDREGNHAPYH